MPEKSPFESIFSGDFVSFFWQKGNINIILVIFLHLYIKYISGTQLVFFFNEMLIKVSPLISPKLPHPEKIWLCAYISMYFLRKIIFHFPSKENVFLQKRKFIFSDITKKIISQCKFFGKTIF